MGSIGTWIAGAVVAAMIGLAIRKIYKDHKDGKMCGSCAGCAGCHDDEDSVVKKTA